MQGAVRSTYGRLIAGPSAARAASTRPSGSVEVFARSDSASKMRTRSRIEHALVEQRRAAPAGSRRGVSSAGRQLLDHDRVGRA